MSSKKTVILVILVLIMTISVICVVLFIGSDQTIGYGSKSHYVNNASTISLSVQTPIENIIINAKVPTSPDSFPIFNGSYLQGDKIKRIYGDWTKTSFKNETPMDVAPELARMALQPFGGLPSDAILAYTKVNYAEIGNPYTGEVIERKPTSTFVLFERAINGTPIVGMSDVIFVIFGGDGEVLEIRKHWRTLEYKGTVPLISVDQAIRKLEQREIINPPQVSADAVVTSISLRYYAKSWDADVIDLEPVWEFYATMPSGEPYQFYVYARKFANFTATPPDGRIPFTVTFTDTSDASPTKWLWDFGDGTTSTGQNPGHTYTTAGMYNVSLKAWNELGSDTIEKLYYITARNPEPPQANATALPTTGSVPLNATSDDPSPNTPASGLGVSDGDVHVSVQQWAHTYSEAGSNTVSPTMTIEGGTNANTENSIAVVNPSPTMLPTPSPITTTTIAITSPPTRYIPEWQRMYMPLSPVAASFGVALGGLLYTLRKKNYR
jgi:PKD repeat protein